MFGGNKKDKSRPTKSVPNPNLKDSKNEKLDQPKDMNIKKNTRLSEKVGKTINFTVVTFCSP